MQPTPGGARVCHAQQTRAQSARACEHGLVSAESDGWGQVLLGERVRVQPIDSRLAQAMLDGVPDPQLAWEDGFPMTPVLGIARVIAAAAAPLGPFLAYVIVRRSDGLAVGDAGFHGPPSEAGEVEVGYALVPAARGAGLVHEAMALLVAWAWSQPAVRVITARVDPGNEPSQRVVRRLGFTLDGERDGMSRYVLKPGRSEPARAS
jgi:RimJ/RimL family protein N-acetyltransferase